MTTWFSRFGTNQRLAMLALLLGAGALLSNTAARASLDPRELALTVERGTDRVQPAELADRIIKGRVESRVIDLRDAAAFAAYHIPGAESIPLTALADSDLAPSEPLLLYSEDGSRAAQAWVLLKARRFRAVSLLDGGLEGWKRDVLFPVLKDGGTNAAEQLANDRLKQVSAYFGGTPRAAGGQAEPLTAPSMTVAMPKVELPASAGGPKKPVVRKKKEGC